jgi:hypothetical protein
VPENLCRNEVFHDRGDYQGQARADHHRAPGDHSPLRGRIHFRRLFSSKPILLAVRRRTIHFSTADSSESASARSFVDAKANLRLAPQPRGKEINKNSNGRDCHREADDKPDAYSLLRVHSRSLRRVRADCGVTRSIEELRRVRGTIAAAPTIQLKSSHYTF